MEETEEGEETNWLGEMEREREREREKKKQVTRE